MIIRPGKRCAWGRYFLSVPVFTGRWNGRKTAAAHKKSAGGGSKAARIRCDEFQCRTLCNGIIHRGKKGVPELSHGFQLRVRKVSAEAGIGRFQSGKQPESFRPGHGSVSASSFRKGSPDDVFWTDLSGKTPIQPLTMDCRRMEDLISASSPASSESR